MTIRTVLMVLAVVGATACTSRHTASGRPHVHFDGLPISEPTFASLRGDEEALVSYDSVGCEHHERYELLFHGPAPVSVEVFGLSPRPTYDRRTLAGRLLLTDAEVSKLDRLIAFYRTSPSGLCTTEDTITIVWRRQGRQQIEESFVDGSCDVSEDDDAVLSLQALVRRPTRNLTTP